MLGHKVEFPEGRCRKQAQGRGRRHEWVRCRGEGRGPGVAWRGKQGGGWKPQEPEPLRREKQEAMQASGGAQPRPWVVEAGVGTGCRPGV